MYDPFLTSKTLYTVCRSECTRHGVNFDYFYDKVMKARPLPITQHQLMDLLDELLADAFWNDYDRMYEGVPYPEWALQRKIKSIKRKFRSNAFRQT